MERGILEQCARCTEWILRRNPMYLLSAVLMAVGARLYLVDPSNAAGDITLILTTLGLLQVYEWAVSGILLLLHRSQRSPEDKPSLLLVTILFWTGPMAATIEMTALRADLGLVLATSACLIALGELQFVTRMLRVRMTLVSQLVGSACIVLLAIAPAFIRVHEGGAGPNEIGLYAVWWILSGITLAGLGSLHLHCRLSGGGVPAGRTVVSLNLEVTFVALVVGAVAVHLVGMNHALFCHASLFYASPLIIAASVVGVEYLVMSGTRRRLAMVVVSSFPVLAIILASQSFNANVSPESIPKCFRDPMIATSLCAALAWWFAHYRNRIVLVLHAGNASLVLAVYRLVGTFSLQAVDVETGVGTGITGRESVALFLFAVAIYFLASAWLRRSRVEALAALVANLCAVILLVWQRVPTDTFIIYLAVGWSWLIGTRFMAPKLRTPFQVAAVAFLLITTCVYDFTPETSWYARAHGLALIGALSLAGYMLSWAYYRPLSLVSGGAYAAFFMCRYIDGSDSPVATGVVAFSFLLLLTGGLISWDKRRLLDSIHGRFRNEPNNSAEDC